jgi:hypothetical protein
MLENAVRHPPAAIELSFPAPLNKLLNVPEKIK